MKLRLIVVHFLADCLAGMGHIVKFALTDVMQSGKPLKLIYPTVWPFSIEVTLKNGYLEAD